MSDCNGKQFVDVDTLLKFVERNPLQRFLFEGHRMWQHHTIQHDLVFLLCIDEAALRKCGPFIANPGDIPEKLGRQRPRVLAER